MKAGASDRPGAGGAGAFELPSMDAENQTQASAREVHALNG